MAVIYNLFVTLTLTPSEVLIPSDLRRNCLDDSQPPVVTCLFPVIARARDDNAYAAAFPTFTTPVLIPIIPGAFLHSKLLSSFGPFCWR